MHAVQQNGSAEAPQCGSGRGSGRTSNGHCFNLGAEDERKSYETMIQPPTGATPAGGDTRADGSIKSTTGHKAGSGEMALRMCSLLPSAAWLFLINARSNQ